MSDLENAQPASKDYATTSPAESVDLAIQRVKRALEYLRNGKMIIGTDRDDRECEADVFVAAEFCNHTHINFMCTQARGLICMTMDASMIDRLQLAPATLINKSQHHTNFTVSVEARDFVTTGISAFDRAQTVRTACSPNCKPEELVTPGHMFPLRANRLGVLGRDGHTEQSTDLVILAGLSCPAAVICEMMSVDGTMAKTEEIQTLSQKFDLPIVSVDDVIIYRKHFNLDYISKVPREQPEFKLEWSKPVPMPSVWAKQLTSKSEFESAISVHAQAFKSGLWNGNSEVLVYILTCSDINATNHTKISESTQTSEKNLDNSTTTIVPLVRIHSGCLTGDTLQSMRCDCGPQLNRSLQMLADHAQSGGVGLLIYVPSHEGRGIGLFNKIKAYELQDQGLDTAEANEALHLPIDARDYECVANILIQCFQWTSIRLLTNNPDKIKKLETFGIQVTERVPVQCGMNPFNTKYLLTKQQKFGHQLSQRTEKSNS